MPVRNFFKKTRDVSSYWLVRWRVIDILLSPFESWKFLQTFAAISENLLNNNTAKLPYDYHIFGIGWQFTLLRALWHSWLPSNMSLSPVYITGTRPSITTTRGGDNYAWMRTTGFSSDRPSLKAINSAIGQLYFVMVLVKIVCEMLSYVCVWQNKCPLTKSCAWECL